MKSRAKGRIERVVVPLDAASDYHTAVDTAARLAARVKAPLHGVFVEDEELLRAAGLRFTRQTTLGAAAEPFTPERIAHELRAAAERARRDLADAAARHELAASFEVVSGPSERVLIRASERDLVVASGFSRPVAGHFRLESRWFASVEAATGPFLLARRAWRADGGVVGLLRDRSPQSVRLLDATAEIAEAQGGGLTVIAPPEIAASAGFDKWIAERLAAYDVPLQIEIAPVEPQGLAQQLAELGCRLLAVEAKAADGIAARLRECAAKFAYDILVVC